MSARKSSMAQAPTFSNRLDAVLAAGICKETDAALTALSLSNVADKNLAHLENREANAATDMYIDMTDSRTLQQLFGQTIDGEIIYKKAFLHEDTPLTERKKKLLEWQEKEARGFMVDIGSYGVFESIYLPSYDGDPAINRFEFIGYVDARTFKRFGSGEVKEFRRMIAPRDGAYAETYVRPRKDAPWRLQGETEKKRQMYRHYSLYDISDVLSNTYNHEDNSVIFFREGGVMSGGTFPNSLIPFLMGPL